MVAGGRGGWGVGGGGGGAGGGGAGGRAGGGWGGGGWGGGGATTPRAGASFEGLGFDIPREGAPDAGRWAALSAPSVRWRASISPLHVSKEPPITKSTE